MQILHQGGIFLLIFAAVQSLQPLQSFDKSWAVIPLNDSKNKIADDGKTKTDNSAQPGPDSKKRQTQNDQLIVDDLRYAGLLNESAQIFLVRLHIDLLFIHILMPLAGIRHPILPFFHPEKGRKGNLSHKNHFRSYKLPI